MDSMGNPRGGGRPGSQRVFEYMGYIGPTKVIESSPAFIVFYKLNDDQINIISRLDQEYLHLGQTASISVSAGTLTPSITMQDHPIYLIMCVVSFFIFLGFTYCRNKKINEARVLIKAIRTGAENINEHVKEGGTGTGTVEWGPSRWGGK